MEKADRIRGELEEVRGRLRHLEQLKASDEYQELEALESRLRLSASAEELATEIELGANKQSTALRGLTSGLLNVEEHSDRAASFIRAAQLLEKASEVLRSARSEWEVRPTRQQWEARVTELNAWLSDQGGSSHATPEQTTSCHSGGCSTTFGSTKGSRVLSLNSSLDTPLHQRPSTS